MKRVIPGQKPPSPRAHTPKSRLDVASPANATAFKRLAGKTPAAQISKQRKKGA